MPNIACQRFLTAILAAGLLFVAPSVKAQNKYDVLARVLQPYGALFYSKATTKAMQADVILRDGPPTAMEILDRPLRIFLQIQDKLRIETLTRNTELSFAAMGKSCGFIPMVFWPVLPPGNNRAQKEGFQIFVCLLKISKSYGFLPCLRSCDLSLHRMPQAHRHGTSIFSSFQDLRRP